MNLYYVLPLFQTLFSLVLLPIVLMGHFRSAIHRLFSLHLLGLMIWGILIFFMRSSPTLELAYAWDKWAVAISTFLAIIIYQFSLLFSGIRVRNWLLPSAYAICIIFFVLSVFGWVITGMQYKPYGYAPIGSPLLLAMLTFVFLFTTAAAINFWRVFRHAPDNEDRNRSAYIFAGLLVSMIGGAFDMLPLLGLPLYPGFIIGSITFCLLTAVAIVKYHLLDINIVIKKGIAYFLASAAVAIPYLGVIMLLNWWLGQSVPLVAYAILLPLFAFLLQPLWRWMQNVVDRLFYRARYEAIKKLDEFSRADHKIDAGKPIGSSLVELLQRALQASGVYLLVPSTTGDFVLTASANNNTGYQINMASHHPILRWLQHKKVILHHRDIANISKLQSLTENDVNELNKIKAELFVPILDIDKELCGVVILGQKLSQQPYSGEDEHMALTVADRMAIELENARLYELERTMRTELQKQTELKTEFLHSVAHELKTPLTSIIASSELLDSGMPANNLRERLVANITRSAQVMDRRVSELLDFAKVQAGESELKIEPVEVGQTINEVVSQLSILFQNKNQSLKLEMPNTKLQVKADREKLEQILVNLLSNANKFSPTGSTIALRVRAVDSKVIVEVEDSASAITEREKRRLFEPYYRGDDKGKRERVPGLGIGLSITKKLVELQNGEIRVESKPGRGNTFSFFLPAYSGE